jgi:hypothetical protein
MATIMVDVEAGENCPYSMQLVFSGLDEPRPVRQVRLFLAGPEGVLYDITGWDETGPCAAMSAAVEDSGQGRAYLVYGGAGGLRYRPAGPAEAWDLGAEDQWGDSHLLLSDREDIVFATDGGPD